MYWLCAPTWLAMARSCDPQLRLEAGVWGSVAVAAFAGASYHPALQSVRLRLQCPGGFSGRDVCTGKVWAAARARGVGPVQTPGVSRVAGVHLQFVGLSVLDTARELKEYQKDALYTELVDTMLPDRRINAAALRSCRMLFGIVCEVLAKGREFKALLDTAEAVRYLHSPSQGGDCTAHPKTRSCRWWAAVCMVRWRCHCGGVRRWLRW